MQEFATLNSIIGDCTVLLFPSLSANSYALVSLLLGDRDLDRRKPVFRGTIATWLFFRKICTDRMSANIIMAKGRKNDTIEE